MNIGTLAGQMCVLVIPAAFLFMGWKGLIGDEPPVTSNKRTTGFWVAMVVLIGVGVGCWLAWNGYVKSWVTTGKLGAAHVIKARPGTRKAGPTTAEAVGRGGVVPAFRSVAGNFTVNVPAQLKDISASGGSGSKGAKMHAFEGLDLETEIMYRVGYVDLTTADVPDLKGEAADILTGAGLTPEAAEDFVFMDRFPGYEAGGWGMTDDVELRGFSQCILVKKRVYLLLVAGPAEALDDDVAADFLDSFQLVTVP